MVESGKRFSQTEYDNYLGVPAELQGSVKPEAQILRYEGLISLGVPQAEALEQLGLNEEDIKQDLTKEV